MRRKRIDAEIESGGKPATERWQAWVDMECTKAYDTITPVLDAETASEEDRTGVRLVLNQVRYLERLREQL